jgi:hypothetical protein
MKLNSETLRAIRADMNAALESVRLKYKLSSLAAECATYDPAGHFTFKVEGTMEGCFDRIAHAYESTQHLYPGLPPLGATVVLKGSTYTVEGRRNSKVVVQKVANGKTYTTTVDTLARLWATQNKQSVSA